MLRQTALNLYERSAFGQISSGLRTTPDTPFEDIGEKDRSLSCSSILCIGAIRENLESTGRVTQLHLRYIQNHGPGFQQER